MSLLKTVAVNEADGKVKEIYDEIQNTFGQIPNGIQLWSMDPKALEDQWSHIKETLSMDKDTQKLHTILRFLTAKDVDCKYCVGFNAGMLINMFGMNMDELEGMKKSPLQAPLNEKNKELLVFTLKALKNAHEVNSRDIEKLEKLGLNQMEIFDTVRRASHMLVVTTLFDTFKVEKDI